MTMNTTSKIALGVLGAVAAGVVIGLLLAPEKGTETRKKIKKTAGGWVDSLGHLFSDGRHEAEAVTDKNKIKESLA